MPPEERQTGRKGFCKNGEKFGFGKLQFWTLLIFANVRNTQNHWGPWPDYLPWECKLVIPPWGVPPFLVSCVLVPGALWIMRTGEMIKSLVYLNNRVASVQTSSMLNIVLITPTLDNNLLYTFCQSSIIKILKFCTRHFCKHQLGA